jgi:hypothetical protein
LAQIVALVDKVALVLLFESMFRSSSVVFRNENKGDRGLLSGRRLVCSLKAPPISGVDEGIHLLADRERAIAFVGCHICHGIVIAF